MVCTWGVREGTPRHGRPRDRALEDDDAVELPACQNAIRHSEVEEMPLRGITYRCHVCRLELVMDERSGKMVLAPFGAERPEHSSRRREPVDRADDRSGNGHKHGQRRTHFAQVPLRVVKRLAAAVMDERRKRSKTRQPAARRQRA